MMRLTQGTFSFLPDLTPRQITAQVQYCLEQGWAVSVEHTDDPHPRNTFWEMWGPPMFDLRDAAGVVGEIDACRAANPDRYVRVNAFDSERAGRRCGSRSSSRGRASRFASASTAPRAPGAASATPCAPKRAAVPPRPTPLIRRETPVRRPRAQLPRSGHVPRCQSRTV